MLATHTIRLVGVRMWAAMGGCQTSHACSVCVWCGGRVERRSGREQMRSVALVWPSSAAPG
eukprot:scaffold5052_cov131-Isochrysis_galbana.AAC.4